MKIRIITTSWDLLIFFPIPILPSYHPPSQDPAHPVADLLAELLEERLPQTQLLCQVDLSLHQVSPMGLFQERRHDLEAKRSETNGFNVSSMKNYG